MGLYEVPLSISLLGFGMGTLLGNPHMCGIMLVLRTLLNMLGRNESMCFICLMFVCQDLLSYYFYFVSVPLGLELWWV